MSHSLDTPFETALRLLLLLDEARLPLDLERIYLLDYLCTDGKRQAFPYPLHGRNQKRRTSIPTRRELCTKALRILLQVHFIDTCYAPDGICLRLSAKGEESAQTMTGPYVDSYRDQARTILSDFGTLNPPQLLHLIYSNTK